MSHDATNDHGHEEKKPEKKEEFNSFSQYENAKRDNFSTLCPELYSGKIVVRGNSPIKIIQNFPDCYYDEQGERHELAPREEIPKQYQLSRKFRNVGYDRYTSKFSDRMLEFSVSWADFSLDANGIEKVEKKTELTTLFKEYYYHLIPVLSVEMAGMTKVDWKFNVKFGIKNIYTVIYKTPPKGIVFEQAEIEIRQFVNGYLADKTYEKSLATGMKKTLIQEIKDNCEEIVNRLGLFIKEVEATDPEQVGSEEMSKALEGQEVARLKGEALKTTKTAEKAGAITDAEARKEANKIDLEALQAKADFLKANPDMKTLMEIEALGKTKIVSTGGNLGINLSNNQNP